MLGMERVVSQSEDYYAISCPSSVGAKVSSLNHDHFPVLYIHSLSWLCYTDTVEVVVR